MSGETGEGAWVDRHGDVWTLGDDGLLHTPETEPFPREHVEKKWGPLRTYSSRQPWVSMTEPAPDRAQVVAEARDALSDFASKHAASLTTAAEDPRAPSFAADWCALVATLTAALDAAAPEEPTDEQVAELAAVLDAHNGDHLRRRLHGIGWQCMCGHIEDTPASAHSTHVAAVLAAYLAQEQTR